MNQNTTPPTAAIIPFQQSLCPPLPIVRGNVDFTRFEGDLTRITAIITATGALNAFVRFSMEAFETRAQEAKANAPKTTVTDSARARYHAHSVRALLTMILKALLGLSFRDLSRHLAESALARRFCQLDEALDQVRVPSKTTLQEYSVWLPEEQMRQIINGITSAAAAPADQPRALAGGLLKEELDLETIWADATCLCPNIHFPTDWVLLRDGVRTLMKAVACIRRKGLVHRMAPPEVFLRQINTLAIEMSQARRKADAKTLRKTALRKMKSLVKTVQGHAERHRELLDKEHAKAGLSPAQAEVILGRIDKVLEQLPAAVKQAHERIIGERKVESADKILSLYEPDVHVIVRGKAGAEVEFGNTLFVAEQRNGLIVDWSLEKDAVVREGALIEQSVLRMEASFGVGPQGSVKKFCYDRGGGTTKVSAELKAKEIKDLTCPRSPAALKEKMQDPEFAEAQKRRGQTEGRIGILKNVFFDGRCEAKGIERRQQAVAWAVLAHNLRVLARQPAAEVEKKPAVKRPKAKAA